MSRKALSPYDIRGLNEPNPRRRVQMRSNQRIRILPILLMVAAILVLSISVARGQTHNTPIFTDYRGVKIGMSADEVRSKLDRVKKGDKQDFLVFSEREQAQIYYDDKGKVTAISIDYFDPSNAPAPDAVLGAAIQAKDDGRSEER